MEGGGQLLRQKGRRYSSLPREFGNRLFGLWAPQPGSRLCKMLTSAEIVSLRCVVSYRTQRNDVTKPTATASLRRQLQPDKVTSPTHVTRRLWGDTSPYRSCRHRCEWARIRGHAHAPQTIRKSPVADC